MQDKSGGYAHPRYAASLAEFGTPRALPRCNGWILERPISGTTYKDAMGCYPIFTCTNWKELATDILELGGDLVSLSLVTDPFGDFEASDLAHLFHKFIPFKQHYVTDLSVPVRKTVRKSARQNATKALKELTVEHCYQPVNYLSEWITLYNHLIHRHHITGLRAFSPKSFQTLLSMPGVEMFIARKDALVVGADLWIVDANIAYAHLSAISPVGYEMRASYALCWLAMQHYADSLNWLVHGAGAGVSDKEDGLTVYKKGWSNATRPVYFCGKIFDHNIYEEIAASKGHKDTDYFPAYRSGEFL